jgi:hypothetical protein
MIAKNVIQSQVQVEVQDSYGARYTIIGQSKEVQGRIATIKTNATMGNKTVSSIMSVGSTGPTMAEQQKNATILAILLGQSTLAESPFVRTIYPDGEEVIWPESLPVIEETPPISFTQRPLNASQELAVQAMLTVNNTSRFTIIQGPPGTGKTTVSCEKLTMTSCD